MAGRKATGLANWRGPIAATLLSLVVATVVYAFATNGLELAIEGTLPVWIGAVELLSAVVVTVAAWTVASKRPAATVGLGVAGIAVVLPILAGWPALTDPFRAVALAVTPLAIAGTTQTALRWSPDVSTSRPLVLVYLITAGASILHFVAYNPLLDPGCDRLSAGVNTWGMAILDVASTVALTVVLNVVAAAIGWRAMVGKPGRATPGIVVAGAAFALLVQVVASILRMADWGQGEMIGALVLHDAGIVGLGLAVMVSEARSWRIRLTVERLVARLSDPETAFQESAEIKAVQFAVPDEERWVDAFGREVSQTDFDRQVVVSDGSGPIVRLLISPGRDFGDITGALTPATRLALKNAQLAAATRTRVADIQESRRRVVTAADRERIRIERDLHDGAQQRLVSASIHMKLAKRRITDDSDLSLAEELVGDALGGLRRLAHGMFPTVLATDGLWAALDELVRESGVPVALDLQGDDTVPPEVAHAAYAVGAAVLSRSRAVTAEITGRRQGDTLEIEVRAQSPGETADYSDLDDRVGAAGGELTVSHDQSMTTLRALLPCE